MQASIGTADEAGSINSGGPRRNPMQTAQFIKQQTQGSSISLPLAQQQRHCSGSRSFDIGPVYTLRLVLSCRLTRLSAIVVSLWLDGEHKTVCLSNCDNQTSALNNLGSYLRHICLAEDYALSDTDLQAPGISPLTYLHTTQHTLPV